MQHALPLTILTGFLGAGKTTLLNRILNGDHGLRVAVLVNDFGSINIDANLIVGVEDDMISLANGCVCCSVRDDLIKTVLEVCARPERPEYVILEASGVADPSALALTFAMPELRHLIRLDSIMCIVDAEQVFAVEDQMELKIRQIAFSDMVILNKVDLVGDVEIAKIKDWLAKRLYRFRLYETSHCIVPLGILLGVGRFDAAQLELDDWAAVAEHCDDPHSNHDRAHDHSRSFTTWSYETDRPLSLETLRETASKLPNNVYRAKGVVLTADEPQQRAVLQVVGKRVDIYFDGHWGDKTPCTQIIAIGGAGSIDAGELQQKFDSCITGA